MKEPDKKLVSMLSKLVYLFSFSCIWWLSDWSSFFLIIAHFKQMHCDQLKLRVTKSELFSLKFLIWKVCGSFNNQVAFIRRKWKYKVLSCSKLMLWCCKICHFNIFCLYIMLIFQHLWMKLIGFLDNLYKVFL